MHAMKRLMIGLSLVVSLVVGVAGASAHARTGGATPLYLTCSRTYTGEMAYSGQQFMSGFYATLGVYIYGKLDSQTHEYCGSAQAVAQVTYGSPSSCIQISAYMSSAGGKTTQTTCSQNYTVYVYGPWVSDNYDPLDGIACFYSNCVNVQAYW